VSDQHEQSAAATRITRFDLCVCVCRLVVNNMPTGLLLIPYYY
jgi:hypothetical protein